MRAFPIAMMLAILAAPAYAQPAMNLITDKPALTSDEIEKNKAIDEAYKSAIKKLPDQKPSTDPWGNVRAPEPAKGSQARSTQAKSSQAKTTQAKPQQPAPR